LNFAEYIKSANEQTTIIVQIEHRDAVSNIDTILGVTGLDAVFIGPYDLSGSLGLLGQVTHEEVSGAISVARSACARSNLAYGIYCSTTELAKKEIEAGARLVAVGTDILHLASASRSALENLRGK
jgi:2-keto-3-deoxy-L-rhamnonate aldolase RhmA